MAHAVKAGYIMLYVVVIVRKKTSELNETRPKDRVRNTFIFKRTVRVIVGVTLEYLIKDSSQAIFIAEIKRRSTVCALRFIRSK